MKKIFLSLFIVLCGAHQLGYAASAQRAELKEGEKREINTKINGAGPLQFINPENPADVIMVNSGTVMLVDQDESLEAYIQRSIEQGSPVISIFNIGKTYYSGAAEVNDQLPEEKDGDPKRAKYVLKLRDLLSQPTQTPQPAAPVTQTAQNPGGHLLRLLQQQSQSNPTVRPSAPAHQTFMPQVRPVHRLMQPMPPQQPPIDLLMHHQLVLQQQLLALQQQQQQQQEQLRQEVLRLQGQLNAARLAHQNLFNQAREANAALSRERQQQQEMVNLQAQLEEQKKLQQKLQDQINRLTQAEASQDPQKIQEALKVSFMGPSIVDTDPVAAVMQPATPAPAAPTTAAAAAPSEPPTTYVRPAGPTAAHKPPKPDPRPVISTKQLQRKQELEEYIRDGIPSDDLMDMGFTIHQIKAAVERIQQREAWENSMIEQAEQERITQEKLRKQQIKEDEALARGLQASLDVGSDGTSKKDEAQFTVVGSKSSQGTPAKTETNAERNKRKRESQKEKRRLEKEAEDAQKVAEAQEAARLAKIAKEEAEIAAAQEEALQQVLANASSDKARKERLERLTLAGKLEPKDLKTQEPEKPSGKKKKTKTGDSGGGADSAALEKDKKQRKKKEEQERRMLAAAAEKNKAARQALEADPINTLPSKEQQDFRKLIAKQSFTEPDFKKLQRYVKDEKKSIEIRVLAARALLEGKILSRNNSTSVDQEFLNALEDAAELCSSAEDYLGIVAIIKMILGGKDASNNIKTLNFYIKQLKEDCLLPDDQTELERRNKETQELEVSVNALIKEAEAVRKAPQLTLRFDNLPAPSSQNRQLDDLRNKFKQGADILNGVKNVIQLFSNPESTDEIKKNISIALNEALQHPHITQDDKQEIARTLRYINIITGHQQLLDNTAFMEIYRTEESAETFDTELLNLQFTFVNQLLQKQQEPITLFQALEFAEQVLPVIAYHSGILKQLDPEDPDDKTIEQQISHKLIILLNYLLELTQKIDLSLVNPLINDFAQILQETLSTQLEGEEPVSFAKKEEILRKLQELIEKSS